MSTADGSAVWDDAESCIDSLTCNTIVYELLTTWFAYASRFVVSTVAVDQSVRLLY